MMLLGVCYSKCV